MKHLKGMNEQKEEISFVHAFNTYIKGQVVRSLVSIPPYSGNFYGEGMKFENGYLYVHFGGGCSGEDCNTTWIIDPSDNIVASDSW